MTGCHLHPIQTATRKSLLAHCLAQKYDDFSAVLLPHMPRVTIRAAMIDHTESGLDIRAEV